MKLLSKAKDLLHKASPARVSKQPTSTGSPRLIRRLEVNRGLANRSWKGRRALLPTLWIQCFGKRYEEVHRCLQDIEGLEFRNDGSVVAGSKLGENALDSTARAIETRSAGP